MAEKEEAAKKVTAVISYDLVTPPGMHGDFIDEMKKEKWKFSYGSSPLPNTTCWATFQGGVGEDEAIRIAETDIRKAEAELKKKDAKFKVERFYVVAFPVPTSKMKAWP